MAIEREIKLAIASQAHAGAKVCAPVIAGLIAYLDALPDATAGGSRHLVNRYFDTPDLAFARAKAALRLRHSARGDTTNGQWRQTLKTVGHSTGGGLHARHEWETSLDDGVFDLAALLAICDQPDAVALLRQHADRLTPLFDTDFTRRTWRVTQFGVRVEIALDLGEVVVHHQGERHTAPLCELEIEALDETDEAEAALHALSDTLRRRFPDLQPDDVSKAARGYRLRASLLDKDTADAPPNR